MRRYGLRQTLPLKPGSNDSDLHRVAERFVGHYAEVDLNIVHTGCRADQLARLVHIVQRQVARCRDVDQNRPRALQPALVDQRAENCGASRFHRCVLAACRGGPHNGEAHAGHDRSHVCEVAIDETGRCDDVADALHALPQNIVGQPERLVETRSPRNELHQPVVGNRDDRIHGGVQLCETLVRLAHAPRALKAERPSDDGDSQRPQFLGESRNHRRRAGTGAAAQSGGDEYHVGAFQHLHDPVRVFQSGLPADNRVGTRSESVRDARANGYAVGALGSAQSLRVGVHDVELNARYAHLQHPVDCV